MYGAQGFWCKMSEAMLGEQWANNDRRPCSAQSALDIRSSVAHHECNLQVRCLHPDRWATPDTLHIPCSIAIPSMACRFSPNSESRLTVNLEYRMSNRSLDSTYNWQVCSVHWRNKGEQGGARPKMAHAASVFTRSDSCPARAYLCAPKSHRSHSHSANIPVYVISSLCGIIG